MKMMTMKITAMRNMTMKIMTIQIMTTMMVRMKIMMKMKMMTMQCKMSLPPLLLQPEMLALWPRGQLLSFPFIIIITRTIDYDQDGKTI